MASHNTFADGNQLLLLPLGGGDQMATHDPYPSNWWDHTLACRNQSVGLAITGPLFTERVEPEAGRGINRLINRPSFSSAVLDDPPLPSAWYQTPKFSSTLLSSTLNSTGSRLTDYSYSTGSGRRTTLKQRGLD